MNVPNCANEPTASVNDLPYLVRWSRRAMFRLAAATACTIASILCFCDAVGILPDVSSPLFWFVRTIGLWLNCWCLWFLGFVALLFAARAFTLGVQVDERGLRSWRFGKTVPGEAVLAVTCEPQPFFSRVFFLNPPVFKLTVFFEKRTTRGGKRRSGPPEIGTEHIASMYFDASDFESLLVYICQRAFSIHPSDWQLAIAQPDMHSTLCNSYNRAAKTRVLVSSIIFFELNAVFMQKNDAEFHVQRGLA
jgi:hypothetical protein